MHRLIATVVMVALSFPFAARAERKFHRNQIAYAVWNLETGKWIARQNSKKKFILASLTKIPTTLMALDLLGPDFRFRTQLGTTGKVVNGTLEGDLYFYGSGDPFFTMSHLAAFAQTLRDSGILKVKGKFYYDDHLLYSTEMIDPNGEPDKPFNSGMSALSLEFNRFYLWREPGTSWSAVPPLPSFSIVEQKKPIAPGVDFLAKTTSSKEVWTVSKHKGKKDRETLPVRNPSLYAAETLRLVARQVGVQLPVAQRGSITGKDISWICLHDGRRLVELAEGTLEYSNNLLAELILQRAARKVRSRPQSLKMAAGTLKSWLKEKVNGISMRQLRLENGSGLNSKNKISAQNMIRILQFAEDKRFDQKPYWSLLPISGWKGSIRTRMDGPATSLKVWAKTGNLDFASAIAGYLFTHSGKKLAFAILINDAKKRAVLDRGMTKKAAHLRKDSMDWKKDAQEAQAQLIESWIAK